MNNKFLTLALGTLFLCAGTLATSAQKYVDYTKDASSLVVGDTVVMIDGNPSHYLTGEKIPKWVYQKRHTVMQIGTKRFPNGVLLREIYSWVDLNYMYKPQDLPQEQSTPIVEQTETKPVQPVEQTKPEETKPEETQPVEETKPAEQAQEQQQPEEQQPEEEKKGEEEVAPVPGFHRFSIGVRGGAASLMQDVKGSDLKNWKLGYNAMLDLQYAYYFARKKHPERAARHGILVDLSAGYTNSPLKGSVDSTFTMNGHGTTYQYNISAADVKENDGQVQIELALMYSLLCKGFFFNIGPKAIVPVFSHYNQSMSQAGTHIEATTPQGVTIIDELATGKPSEFASKGKFTNSKINLAIAADLGYEFKLRSGNALGLGVYADYSIKDFGFDGSTNKASLIDVSLNDGAAANTVITPALDTYASKLNGFDAGVKLIYHFNFPKQF